MRVGFDEQAVVGQSSGGISRYVVELVRAFGAADGLDVEPVLGWRYGINAYARDAGLARTPRLARGRTLARASAYAGNTGARRQARQADVWHHTYYLPRFLNLRSHAVTVTTVHDMIPELSPELFPGGDPHLHKRDFVHAADLVLCVSESTRRDLQAVYGALQVPVLVTPLGVADCWFPPAPGGRPPDHDPGSVLFVGRRHSYKDFDVLLRAMTRVDARWTLLAVGGGEFTDDEIRRIAALGLGHRVARRDATDVELARLYRQAAVFVFPSRYEGFGLPTLEAMAAGCPVVLADSSSHPEVGGVAAAYFTPQDDTDLGAVLTAVLDDPSRRARMSAEGTARARAFSWHATASLTAAAYRAVLPAVSAPVSG